MTSCHVVLPPWLPHQDGLNPQASEQKLTLPTLVVASSQEFGHSEEENSRYNVPSTHAVWRERTSLLGLPC